MAGSPVNAAESEPNDGPPRIGIAVSGGGYRAAAWGLGTLLYLVDAGLNGRVTTISSVSGGSIPNAVLGAGGYSTLDTRAMRSLGADLAKRLAGNLWLFLGVLALHVGGWAF